MIKDTSQKVPPSSDEHCAEAEETSQVEAQEETTEQAKMAEASQDEQASEQNDDSDESLDSKASENEQALQKLQDRLMRTSAEMENMKRRMQKEIEKTHQFGTERFIKELLPVVDNLERSLSESVVQEDKAQQAFVEGIKLTHKIFIDSLQKFKVEAVDPKGEPFNPEFHQAVSLSDSPDCEPNTVIDVIQKGYTNHGRLVRPAMVIVQNERSESDQADKKDC